MQRTLRFFGTLLLVLHGALTGVAQDLESFTVSNLTATNAVLDNFVYGLEIQFTLDYTAKKGLVKDTEIAVYFTTDDGTPVASHANGTTYRDPDNRLRVVSKLPNGGSGISTHRVLVPYYAIALPEGDRTLQVVPRLKKLLKDEVRELPVAYTGADTVTLEMPALRRVSLRISGLSVEPTNLDGGSWDGTLGLGKEEAKLPDLQYRLYLEGVVARDEVFLSQVQDNVTEATWAQPSASFYLAPEDQLTLEVVDNDGLTDPNRIGQRRLRLTDLEAFAETPGLLPTFDRVKTVTVAAFFN